MGRRRPRIPRQSRSAIRRRDPPTRPPRWRAKASGRRVILVFGANWRHDSRVLAGWFATSRFRAMLAPRYEIAWIDVGRKDKNLDLARRFGLAGIKGTPTVLVTDAGGHPVNLTDAPTWHDVSSRREQAIYDYFAAAPAR